MVMVCLGKEIYSWRSDDAHTYQVDAKQYISLGVAFPTRLHREYLDQPAHSCMLIRISIVRLKSNPAKTLISDFADEQAGLRRR